MFSSTAYDAFYTYIGLHLHSALIEILTSQKFFLSILILIFGVTFFTAVLRFFSFYLPSLFKLGSGANALTFFRLLICLFLGIALLKAGSTTHVKNFKRVSWHNNPYVKSKVSDIKPTYRVSFIFDLLSRSSEEIAAYLGKTVDRLFKTTNSQLEAPSFFYKAIMFAGMESLQDPGLKDKVNFYTSECFEKVLPLISNAHKKDKLDLLFSDGVIDNLLSSQKIQGGKQTFTCLELKNDVKKSLRVYSQGVTKELPDREMEIWAKNVGRGEVYANISASQALVNHYITEKETPLGTHYAAIPPGTTAKIFLTLNRVFSWDGLLNMFGQSDKMGAASAAAKAQEFSEHLQRAPHIQGFVKMMLIAVFPTLVFFMVAGRWRVLVYWTALYFSVLMWTPIWTLFYHITTNIALSTETMAAFGKLSDGISLYSSQMITSRLYYYYAMYSWVQILVGPLPTACLAWNLRPLLGGGGEERAPEFISEGKNVAVQASRLL